MWQGIRPHGEALAISYEMLITGITPKTGTTSEKQTCERDEGNASAVHAAIR